MSRARESSGFKYVFWGIFFLIFVAIAGQIMWLMFGGFRPIPHLIGIGQDRPILIGPGVHWFRWVPMAALPIILLVVWVGVVGPLVYRDAKKRGMDPYLWTAVAVFLPFFLGIIIYLVARSNGRTACGSCGEPIHSDYKVCPYCGHRRELLCSQCSKPVAPEWRVCPYCEHKLVPAP